MAKRSLQICAINAFSIICCSASLHSEEILEEAQENSEYITDLEIDENCKIHGKAASRNPKRNRNRVRSSKKDQYAVRGKAARQPTKAPVQTTEEEHCAVHGKVDSNEEDLCIVQEKADPKEKVTTQCEQPKPCNPKPVCKCRPQPACPKPCPPKLCCPKPCPPKPCCPPEPCCPPVCEEERSPAWCQPDMKGAYNYPADIKTRCPWNVWGDASFLYWLPYEENLEPAAEILSVANLQLAPNVTQVNDINIINMDFQFKPGFKVGVGVDLPHDNWDLGAEYTWFHSTHHKHKTGGVFSPMLLDPFNIAFLQFIESELESRSAILSESGDSFKESWRLNIDFVDVDLGRWYYVGRKLTFHPFFGARGAFIDQKLDVTYVTEIVATNTGTVISFPGTLNAKTTSWGVGPQAGIDVNWNLSKTFRLFGNGSGDILFTRYNYHQTGTLILPAVGGPISLVSKASQNEINSLRTHLDLEMGIGWGGYFTRKKWYLDLSASYGFQVFFDQNMFRHFSNAPFFTSQESGINDTLINPVVSTQPSGNLYIQGLTATVKVAF